MTHMRNGHFPGNAEADWLNRFPLIDALRTRVQETDVQRLLGIVEDGDGPSAGFALSLVRHYSTEPEVKTRIQARWESASPYLKCHLLWRLLDDPELPEAWHRKLFNFILEAWDTFRQTQIKFMGTPQNVIPRALRRIGDPSFPESKKWAYLCCVPEVADDQIAARALVSLGLRSSDPFTQEVAKQLLNRFFVEHA